MSTVGLHIKKQRVHDGLVEDIRKQIRDGILRSGHYLLPERELATRYRVSSRAVREGLAHLEAEGLIRRHQGRGTMVLRPEPTAPVSKQQKNVAVIFQGRVRDSSTAEDFDGLQQAFQAEGYGTMLYVADSSPEKETQIVRQLAAEGVPGIVLYSAHPMNSFAHLSAAQEAGVKIAVYDHGFPDFECNFVGIDDHFAASEATEHLVRLGCRELLLINSERDWTTHTLRQQGFEEAAQRGGVPYRVVQIPNCGGPSGFDEFIRQGLLPWRHAPQRPLGIIAWWDEAALRAISLLQKMELSVPNDVKVIGFANDRSGAVAEIPLTTMEIPREQIARLAALSLVNQMRDPTRPPQRIRLKARMIIRDSCGTYPSRRMVPDEAGAASPVELEESIT